MFKKLNSLVDRYLNGNPSDFEPLYQMDYEAVEDEIASIIVDKLISEELPLNANSRFSRIPVKFSFPFDKTDLGSVTIKVDLVLVLVADEIEPDLMSISEVTIPITQYYIAVVANDVEDDISEELSMTRLEDKITDIIDQKSLELESEE